MLISFLEQKKTEQDGRLPLAYFLPTKIVKNAFQKSESVFFQILSFSIKFCRFSKFKIFLIPAKNPQSRWKKDIAMK